MERQFSGLRILIVNSPVSGLAQAVGSIGQGAREDRGLWVSRGPVHGRYSPSGAVFSEDNTVYSLWLIELTLSFQRSNSMGNSEVKERPWSRKPLQLFELLEL